MFKTDDNGNPAGRAPTQNEILYLKRQIALNRGLKIFLFIALIIFILLFIGIFFIVLSTGRGWHLLLPLPLLFFAVPFLKIGFIRFGIKDPIHDLVTIEGKYHKEIITGYRSVRVEYYIGEFTVWFPGHWLKYIKEGDHVTAEAYFFTILKSGSEYLLNNPACTLVSLNGRYSVDREVPAGLMNLRFNTSFIFVLIFGIAFILFTAIVSLAEKSLPFNNLFRAVYYNMTPPREFTDVADVLNNEKKALDKIIIRKAVFILSYNTNYDYLADSDGEDEKAYQEALKIEERVKTSREILLKEFEKESGIDLVKEKYWKKYALFSDNPEYREMKENFITKGGPFLKEQREIRRKKLEEEGEENYNPFGFLIEYSVMADKFKRPFLALEKRNLREGIDAENGRIYRQRLTAVSNFFISRFSSRDRIAYHNSWHSDTPSVTETLNTSENAEGLLEKFGGGGAGVRFILYPRFEIMETKYQFFLFFTGIPLFITLLFLPRTIYNYSSNKRILGRLRALYGGTAEK